MGEPQSSLNLSRAGLAPRVGVNSFQANMSMGTSACQSFGLAALNSQKRGRSHLRKGPEGGASLGLTRWGLGVAGRTLGQPLTLSEKGAGPPRKMTLCCLQLCPRPRPQGPGKAPGCPWHRGFRSGVRACWAGASQRLLVAEDQRPFHDEMRPVDPRPSRYWTGAQA